MWLHRLIRYILLPQAILTIMLVIGIVSITLLFQKSKEIQYFRFDFEKEEVSKYSFDEILFGREEDKVKTDKIHQEKNNSQNIEQFNKLLVGTSSKPKNEIKPQLKVNSSILEKFIIQNQFLIGNLFGGLGQFRLNQQMQSTDKDPSIPPICSASVYERKLANGEFKSENLSIHFPRNLNFTDSAIIILASTIRLPLFVKTLRNIFTHFNDEFKYPILIFHFGDLDAHHSMECFKMANFSDTQISLIDFINAEGATEFPPDVGTKQDWAISVNTPDAWRYPNYHHMCAFWSRTIFKQSYFRKNNIKYYWRLDTDSLLWNPIKYDLFEVMKNYKFNYAFRSQQAEVPSVVTDLSKFIHKYAKDHNIQLSKSPMLKTLPDNSVYLEQYYTNFEIVYIPAFRDDPAVSHWLESVWNSGGVYRHRWCGGPIRFYTVHLFPQLFNKLHHLCNIGYTHQMYSFPPSFTFNVTLN